MLRAIENVYDILLDLEEERRPGGAALSDERRQESLDRLWNELGVMEPIDQGYAHWVALLMIGMSFIRSLHFCPISKERKLCLVFSS